MGFGYDKRESNGYQKAQEEEARRTAERLESNLNPIDPQTRAKLQVVEYWNTGAEKYGDNEITIHDLYVVSFKYILGYWKVLISSDAWTDTSYFEVTYNADKEEIYVDHYHKVNNKVYPDSSDFKMAKLRHKMSR